MASLLAEAYPDADIRGFATVDVIDRTQPNKAPRQELAYIGDRPALMAGDFNARPDDPPMRLLTDSARFRVP